MRWRGLTAAELGQINAYDYEHCRKRYIYLNKTRFYKFLTVTATGDVQVRTVACIARRSGKRKGLLEIKEVVRASADSASVWIKDVLCCTMGGYQVDWSPEGCGRARYWSYGGRWERDKYTRKSHMYKLWCPTINPADVKLSARFTWCAYNEDCGDVLDYLKLYKDHPKIEMLAKLGVGRFAQRIGFVRRLEKNGRLLSWFSKNIEDIRHAGCQVDVVNLAFRLGIPIQEAVLRVRAQKAFKKEDLRGIDVYKAYAYVEAQRGCTVWEYGRYLEACARLELNLQDTKVAFPKNFAARSRQMKDRIEKVDYQKLAERAAQFDRLATARGAFAVAVPSTAADFKREGEKLRHCIFTMGYAAKMMRGECVMVFVRRKKKPGEPFVTVELDAKAQKVLQAYGKGNSRPEKAVLDFVNGPLLKAARRCLAGNRERKSA